MTQTWNWGILGTGRIATKFAAGLEFAPGARLSAVGSRSPQGARDFAERFGIPNQHVGYEALVNDPQVDIVYISSPHSHHYEHSLLALQAGKAVLCEKPFTLNAAQARELVALARQRGLFLMEGLWSRFFPLMQEMRRLLDERALGEVQMLAADLGIRRTIESRDRLFRPDLGGGALLDVGVYPLSLASLILGKPERISSMAHIGTYGVDERAGIILSYENGALASLYCAIRTETPKEAHILGTQGSMRLHPNFVIPIRMTLTRQGESTETIERPIQGNGMQFEALEVMHCLQAGKTESEFMPLDESVQVMETLDAIRAQWDLQYPMEIDAGEAR